jgi:Regulator of chromosome condensation (RCC1) repeat
VAVFSLSPEVPCSPGHYLTGVTAISAGEEHSLALLSNGTVMAWGSNVYEQLGDGTETDRKVPVAVSGLSGVTAISAGGGHSLALLSNATVMAWGSDAYGQLGNGTSAISFGVPVAVSGLSGVTGISAGGWHSLSYSASSPPEYGACVKVQADKKGKLTVYHGGFTTATCLEISGTKTGKYEWFPGPPVKAKFTTKLKESTTLTPAVVTFETVTKTKVVCKGETGTGEYTGTTTVGNVVDTFTGCESQKYKALQKDKCKTAGHAEGELVTSTLEGTLGWENKALKHVANDLFPVGHSGPLLEFSCAGVPVQVRGSVIVKVASGKMLPLTKTETVTFAAAKGKQTPEQFEGGVKDVLESSFGVGAFEQTGLKMTTIQTSEEQLEINWSV